MKRLLIGLCLSLAVLGSADCGKKPVNLTPAGNAAFVGDQYITALSDFQDGVEAGYHAGWLSKQNTYLVAQGISVALVSIHAAPDGARSLALATIDDLTAKLSITSEFEKFGPYLTAARLVIGGLK